MKKSILVFLFLLLMLGACGPNKTEQQELVIAGDEVEKTDSETNVRPENVINFGVTPWQSEDKHKALFVPILDYLSEKTGKTFVLNVAPDYQSLQQDMVQGKIDLTVFSPGVFAESKDKVKYIATTSRKYGENEYREYYNGYIVALKSSSANELNDLQGRTIGFVDRASASGYKYPMALILKNGITPKTFFKDIFFLGSHTAVAEAIANQKVEAGAVGSDVYERSITQYGDIFKIICKTPPIPSDALAAGAHVSDDFIDTVREILVNTQYNTQNEQGSPIYTVPNNISGFVVIDASIYDVITESSELLKKLEE